MAISQKPKIDGSAKWKTKIDFSIQHEINFIVHKWRNIRIWFSKLTGYSWPKSAWRNVYGEAVIGCSWWKTVVRGRGWFEPSIFTTTKSECGHRPPSIRIKGTWKRKQIKEARLHYHKCKRISDERP